MTEWLALVLRNREIRVRGAETGYLTSSYSQGQRLRGAISPLPNTPSWRGAQLKG